MRKKSPLDPGIADTFYEPFLGDEKENEQRSYHDCAGGHDKRPVDSVGSLFDEKLAKSDGYQIKPLAADYQKRPEIIVVHEHKIYQTEGDKDRFGERKEHLPQDGPVAGPVDLGGIDQLVRHLQKGLTGQKDGEDADRVGKDDALIGIKPAQPGKHDIAGNIGDRHRQHIGGHHDNKKWFSKPEIQLGYSIGEQSCSYYMQGNYG